MPKSDAIIEIEDLSVLFPMKKEFCKPRSYVRAVNEVSLSIRRNSIFGLAGESGSGKTTTGKAVLGLAPVTKGIVRFNGQRIDDCKTDMKTLRKELQIIFQDPMSSLNPHKRIGASLEEPLNIHRLYPDRIQRTERIESVLADVGLKPSILDRYPHEFSGGQLQRICIARAILLEPSFLICDESIASLDVSIQAQIINLFKKLKEEYNLSLLFISHNISVLRYLCDDLGVMYLGSLVEIADTETLFDKPLHPYTQALLSVVPLPDPRYEATREHHVLQGEIPSPINPPPGCPFSTRCPLSTVICRQECPELRELEPGHSVACHRAGEVI